MIKVSCFRLASHLLLISDFSRANPYSSPDMKLIQSEIAVGGDWRFENCSHNVINNEESDRAISE